MKCFVKGCENHDHEGKFMGYLCLPCHHFIAGKSGGEYSQASRNLQEAIAAAADREPLQWHKAPVKTEWGEGVIEALVEIDKDHTLKLYCEHDQAARVEAMIGARKPLADLVIADIYAKWDATTGVSMADFARAIERAHGIEG